MPLWVDRPDDQERLRRSLAHGFNTLLLGDPGAGRSSLLNWVEEDLREAGRAAVRTSGRRASSPEDVLFDVAEKIQHPHAGLLAKAPTGDRVDQAYQQLLSATQGAHRPPVVLADDMPGPLGH